MLSQCSKFGPNTAILKHTWAKQAMQHWLRAEAMGVFLPLLEHTG